MDSKGTAIVVNYTSKDVARFWSKVNKNGNIPAHCPELGACWEWTGAYDKDVANGGYGFIRINGWTYKTHRVAWAITNGSPGELWVLHKCDNRKCCNPAHLFLGTHQDNMNDKMNKGRTSSLSGETNPSHKLTVFDVEMIKLKRASGKTLREIAREYNVHRTQIGRICRGINWK